MLVTLGTNQALSAGGSVTLPYACRSIQKVFIKVDDTTGSNSWDHTVTIQLGSRTICNGVEGWGLAGPSSLQGNNESGVNEVYYCIDLGSHQLLDNENVYVTVNASSALDAVDVSAIVDEATGGEMPVRYTQYSDNVFTAENVLCAMSYNAARSAVDEDAYNVEIRDSVNSSSPSLISANNRYGAETLTFGFRAYYGILKKDLVPLTTTFNYSASATTNRIIVASLMGTNQRAVKQGQRAQAIAKSQVGK